MKKLLVLVPLFILAACIDIDISVGEKANADDSSLITSGPSDGNRLTRQYMVGVDGSRMETPVWKDEGLGLLCSFQSFPNKNTYCVPEHVNGNYYSDANCTKPIYVEAYTKSNFACHTFPDYVRFGHDYASGCGNVDLGLTMYKIEKDSIVYQGTMATWYEKDNAKACNKKTLTAAGFEVAIFDVTEIGDETKFVQIVQEPKLP